MQGLEGAEFRTMLVETGRIVDAKDHQGTWYAAKIVNTRKRGSKTLEAHVRFDGWDPRSDECKCACDSARVRV